MILPPISPTGLTLPAKLFGDDPILPAALRSASPPAAARARCNITREGRLSGCQVLDAPKDTSALVLAALATWRYRPAHLNGAPVGLATTSVLTGVPHLHAEVLQKLRAALG